MKYPTLLRQATIVSVVALLIVPSLSGCAIFAQVAQALPQVQPPKYANLADQTVAVVVWAEENGVRIDWPNIHMDTAQMIQSKLLQQQATEKPKELKLTRFPLSPASVARFQEENPDSAAQGIAEMAPRLGVSRVIYVEIRGFQTRSEAANDLFRGTLTGSVSVVEVSNGKGRTAFTDDTLKIQFPRISPDEGLPNLGDFAVYHGTLDGFTTEVVKRFVPHGDDPDAEYGAENTAKK